MEKYTSLKDIQKAITSGEIDLKNLVAHYIQKIEDTKNLNAYIEVYAEEALEKAKLLDEKYISDPESVGKLFGMVISIKDVLCYKDHPATAGSKILQNFTAPYSATAIERIEKEDAIIIGRVNCDEFAMGSTNETSTYGPTKNAANLNRIPGGSSGGSAVSVQAGTCLASLGTDTGGSVRQPASFCGIIGFKPTYGRVSRHGLIAYASSFDQIGVLANNIEDTALLLEVMAGADDYDSTASPREVPEYSKGLSFKGKAKIAYFGSALEHKSLDKEISSQCFDLIEKLQAAGHEVEAVDFDYTDHIIPAYYVLTTAEASTNLSRFDGVRYGYRSPEVENLDDTYRKSRTEGFGEEVKRRIMLGTFVLSSGYYDAYYSKAQQVRRLIREKTFEIFEQYDFILMPTAPGTAWELGETQDDPVAMYLADIFTVLANMTGIPAIAIPVGTHSNGLPVGVQFLAHRFEEEKLLAFSGKLLATDGALATSRA